MGNNTAKTQAIINDFDTGLQLLKDNGQYQEIIDKWERLNYSNLTP